MNLTNEFYNLHEKIEFWEKSWQLQWGRTKVRVAHLCEHDYQEHLQMDSQTFRLPDDAL